MNILIVDDDINKIDSIKNSILNYNVTAVIRSVGDYEHANNFIYDNKDDIDLIVLDWCFPLTSYSESKFAMGKRVLTYMKLNDIDIKTIICSSDVININKNDFPFVIGSIVYHDNLDVYPQMDKMLYPEKYETPSAYKQLKRVKEDTGYKRHRSSDPWWK